MANLHRRRYAVLGVVIGIGALLGACKARVAADSSVKDSAAVNADRTLAYLLWNDASNQVHYVSCNLQEQGDRPINRDSCAGMKVLSDPISYEKYSNTLLEHLVTLRKGVRPENQAQLEIKAWQTIQRMKATQQELENNPAQKPELQSLLEKDAKEVESIKRELNEDESKIFVEILYKLAFKDDVVYYENVSKDLFDLVQVPFKGLANSNKPTDQRADQPTDQTADSKDLWPPSSATHLIAWLRRDLATKPNRKHEVIVKRLEDVDNYYRIGMSQLADGEKLLSSGTPMSDIHAELASKYFIITTEIDGIKGRWKGRTEEFVSQGIFGYYDADYTGKREPKKEFITGILADFRSSIDNRVHLDSHVVRSYSTKEEVQDIHRHAAQNLEYMRSAITRWANLETLIIAGK